ncbi:MAG TPA: PfkB family carbohydrate kinase [Verrucomicrobiae bacterium]|nr:PfkB family carbohydrate kinase [Verrucomicrobiae bacterium]
MKIAVIVPFPGKQKFQAEYDCIVSTIENAGDTVLSPEKVGQYQRTITHDSTLRDTPKAHYEFIRKSIIDSDAVIVEASWEDFRVGHETTLALLYRKPVLALSQSLDLRKYIHHPDFYASKYTPVELPNTIRSFLDTVRASNNLDIVTKQAPVPQRQKTIVVFGGVYADIFNRVARIPRENEVALSDNFKISLGGKATNAAIALARMNNEVFICGQVGHDIMGSDLEAVLIHEGIKTDFLHQDKQSATGTVTLAVDHAAKYSTIVHEAANIRITKAAVDAVFREVDAGRLHPDCIYLTLEPQKTIVEYIIREAHKRQLFIFCDAAPHTRPLDAALLSMINIVAPNQLEAHAMTGITIDDEESAERAATKLSDHGAQQIVITLGDKGAYYQKDGKQVYEAALRVQATDEAGAGDAFRAIFVHELLHNKTVRSAMRRANEAGAYAVAHFGSYDSMPDSEHLKAFSESYKDEHVRV